MGTVTIVHDHLNWVSRLHRYSFSGTSRTRTKSSRLLSLLASSTRYHENRLGYSAFYVGTINK